MAHQDQLDAQYDSSTDSYSFDNNFKHVKKYIENADYSIANLETTLAGNKDRPYSAYPLFNSPDELADALKKSGFDLISTINNHSFDMGSLGVNRTLSLLKKRGFDTVGTRENSSDDDYIIKNINNIEIEEINTYTIDSTKEIIKKIRKNTIENEIKSMSIQIERLSKELDLLKKSNSNTKEVDDKIMKLSLEILKREKIKKDL